MSEGSLCPESSSRRVIDSVCRRYRDSDALRPLRTHRGRQGPLFVPIETEGVRRVLRFSGSLGLWGNLLDTYAPTVLPVSRTGVRIRTTNEPVGVKEEMGLCTSDPERDLVPPGRAPTPDQVVGGFRPSERRKLFVLFPGASGRRGSCRTGRVGTGARDVSDRPPVWWGNR